jgi:nucleotide-binding universal stress UspA family protein
MEAVMAYTVKSILYATDLGPHGPEVFSHATAVAQQFGAKIHIVHVVEPMGEYAHSLLVNYLPEDKLNALRREGFDEARQEISRRLEKFCQEKLYAGTAGLVASAQVLDGLPYQVILDEAKRINADLIVMGSHGQTALGEMFMGSVAHKVTLKSTVPVLLVPIKRE